MKRRRPLGEVKPPEKRFSERSAFRPYFGVEPDESEGQLLEVYSKIKGVLNPQQLRLALHERQTIGARLKQQREDLAAAVQEISVLKQQLSQSSVSDQGIKRSARELKAELERLRRSDKEKTRRIGILTTQLDKERIEADHLRSRRPYSVLGPKKTPASNLSSPETAKTHAQIAKVKEELSATKGKLEKVNERYKATKEELNELEKERDSLASEVEVMESDQERKQMQHELEVKLIKDELEYALQKIKEQTDQENKLDDSCAQVEELKAKLMSQELILEEAKSLSKNTHDHAKEIRGLQRREVELSEQNKRLEIRLRRLVAKEETDEAQITELTRQNEDLKERHKKLQENMRMFVKVQEENKALKNSIESWESKFGISHGGLEFQTPEELARRINSLQSANETLTAKVSKSEAQIQTMTAQKRLGEQRIEDLKSALEEQCTALRMAEGEAREHKLWRNINEKQNERYRLLLDSYNKEDAVGQYDRIKTERIAMLEEAVAEREGLVRQLEEQMGQLLQQGMSPASAPPTATGETTPAAAPLQQGTSKDHLTSAPPSQLQTPAKDKKRKLSGSQAAAMSPYRLSGKVTALEKELDALQKQLERADVRYDKLMEENAVLRSRVVRGDYNPVTTKVLHMTNNPAAKLDDLTALKRLRTQNTELREKYKELEKEYERVRTIVENTENNTQVLRGLGTFSTLDAEETKMENERLKRDLKKEEKRVQRWREMVAKTVADLRAVIRKLLGYELRIEHEDKANVYVLTSIYGPKTDSFKFDADFEMLGRELAEHLEEPLEMYFIQGNSVPAFLSAVTLSYFNE